MEVIDSSRACFSLPSKCFASAEWWIVCLGPPAFAISLGRPDGNNDLEGKGSFWAAPISDDGSCWGLYKPQ